MSVKKIVITGGPGTGKSSIIDELNKRGHACYFEVSRQVTVEARRNGIDQLFLTEPLLFSELLFKGRLQQFEASNNHTAKHVFMDRGLPDVLAYMDYAKTEYPDWFNHTCKTNIYDQIFVLAPWQDIYKSDNERYENFGQAIVNFGKAMGNDPLNVHYLVDMARAYEATGELNSACLPITWTL